MLVRLQKIIADAGVASRRAAEQLISGGAVTVNGRVVSELGSKADPDKDHIKVSGRLLQTHQPKVYVLLNKPAGVVTTARDPEGRPTVMSLLKGVRARVFPVGRLDCDSEGLVFLTNDGDLAYTLMQPRFHVPKTYELRVKGVLPDEALQQLARGVKLTDGTTAPCRVEKVRKAAANSWIRVTLTEGRKRQIRRMVEAVGYRVLRLRRIQLGPLKLDRLAPGSYRHLVPAELELVRQYVAQVRARGAGRRAAPAVND